MSPELTEKLVQAFPLLYSDRTKPPTESLMCFGFACYDGWFNLIWELSSKLEPLIEKYKQENPDEEHPRAVQVKEKFGGLRFYMFRPTKEMDDTILDYEKLSLKTCEQCGNVDNVKQTKGVWIKTLCDDCDS